jgi:hypothetical protein
MIHLALVKYLVERQAIERKAHKELFVSDLGQHPYKAMSRVMGLEREPFDVDTLIKMQGGNAMEADTLQALQWAYGKVATQFPLHNAIWSGYADAVIGHGTTAPIIVEHKATGDQWFGYKNSLPRSSHACQVWLYQQLYNETFGVYPRAIIYYRAWGSWAEFEITENADGTLLATGTIRKDKGAAAHVARKIECLPHLLRAELEDHFTNGDIPDPNGLLKPDSWTYAEDHYQLWQRDNGGAV